MHPTGANPPNMVTPNDPARTYDNHTIDTLQKACDHVDRCNDEINHAYGMDIHRCESHKINTNNYVCMFDAIVQITIQQRTTGIGVQMWLCDDCFTQIHAQWRALNG